MGSALGGLELAVESSHVSQLPKPLIANGLRIKRPARFWHLAPCRRPGCHPGVLPGLVAPIYGVGG